MNHNNKRQNWTAIHPSAAADAPVLCINVVYLQQLEIFIFIRRYHSAVEMTFQ